jgi:hypothetical protein
MFFEHTDLQIQAAIEGLGFTLGSLVLIESEIASGYLVSPLRVPVWDGPDYMLVVFQDRESDPAVSEFVAWLKREARERRKKRWMILGCLAASTIATTHARSRYAAPTFGRPQSFLYLALAFSGDATHILTFDRRMREAALQSGLNVMDL